MRTTFCSSTLVRLLGEWVPAAPDAAGMDFAERLSLLLNPLDAISLQAVNQQVRARRTAARTTPPALARKLREDLERVRGTLAHAISQEVEPFFDIQLPGRGKRAGLPSHADAAWSGYQHRHAALQRQMEQMTTAVRDHVRQALSTASPRLQQLAALDATLEKVLAAREQAALPRIPRILQRRFDGLRKAHGRAVADEDAAADDPTAWSRPGGWLHAFAQDWRQVLLAERDLRLDPVAGLVEAAATDNDTSA